MNYSYVRGSMHKPNMDQFLQLLEAFLDDDISVEAFKENLPRHYYDSGLYMSVNDDAKEAIESLLLTMNMHENEDLEDTPFSSVSSDYLKTVAEECYNECVEEDLE